MLFVVSGRDRPVGIQPRLKFRDVHRAHYDRLGDDLVLAGPYLDTNGEPIGSMIVIRRESQEAAESHANADPYWLEGVFGEMTVSRWDWFMKRPDALES